MYGPCITSSKVVQCGGWWSMNILRPGYRSYGLEQHAYTQHRLTGGHKTETFHQQSGRHRVVKLIIRVGYYYIGWSPQVMLGQRLEVFVRFTYLGGLHHQWWTNQYSKTWKSAMLLWHQYRISLSLKDQVINTTMRRVSGPNMRLTTLESMARKRVMDLLSTCSWLSWLFLKRTANFDGRQQADAFATVSTWLYCGVVAIYDFELPGASGNPTHSRFTNNFLRASFFTLP